VVPDSAETLEDEFFSSFFGKSRAIQAVLGQVKKVATTDFTVILEGETGTGKEVMAQAVHRLSERHKEPFVALDCGAIPEALTESELFGYEKGAFTGADHSKPGHFELAHKGTLFLDEVNNLSLGVQAKLLRAIENHQVLRLGASKANKVNARLVVATVEPLSQVVKAGGFRRDLYHRLNEFVVKLPPLRHRREDIIHLAEIFIEETNAELDKKVQGLSTEAMAELMTYNWPGNIRELRNWIRRAVLLSEDIIEPWHLFPFSTTRANTLNFSAMDEDGERLSLSDTVRIATEELERRIISRALDSTNGNKMKASRILKVDYKTLYRKLKKYGL
jgi:two-component system nitrogen regulation response regulator GlnG